MAYSNSTSDRMDELRFRNQQSSRNDASMLGLVSPPRNGNRMSQSLQQQESRGGLTRRFTTDSGRVPTIASITSQRGTQETQEYGPSTYHKVQLLEKKKLEYERLREQKRRFEAEMQLLDLQQRREEQELQQMQEDLGRSNNNNNNAGHQSEPTTPPEFRETSSGFPSAFSRPNRYSTSSITSPPGLYNRPGRSGSQLTSPQSGTMQSRLVVDDKLPSKSVPGSRRNSDEDEKEEAVRQDPTSHRSTNALNRYSMPVTKSRNGMHEMLSLDQTNTARFLFGEDENAAPANVDNYLKMNATDDKFPILVRRDEFPGLLSASSAALDLALSQSPAPESNGWSSFARHRPNQQSLPMNNIQSSQQVATSASQSSSAESPISVRPSYRHSLDLKFFEGPQGGTAQVASPPKHVQATPPKLQSSYSANDVPTVRTASNGMQSNNNTPNSHAQQHLHNHNASLGRIPPNAMNRLSREMASGDNGTMREAQNGSYQSIQSALQASAAPFGPALTQGMPQGMSQAQMSPSVTPPTGQQNFPASVPGYYNNYGMHMMSLGMQNMQLSQPMYPPPNSYNNYSNAMYQHNGGQRDSQARVIQQRRQNDGEAMNRFANVALDQLGGEIYALCKDQHGCRYLQKKLEDRNPEQVHMIWLETNQHVIELMTDPFGNYLCQKLLEYCNDEERTVLIENASHDLVRIALNQHGTRALQKMIEFISTPGQVQTIIGALRFRVVELIQDLNGNHVIQKCLNKLSPVDAQFIFDAVGQHCVDVGTHRHGCCVLQRCIDHASGDQKAWLIRQISNNAYVLVQDPFGNYVVQYILDLNEPIFTEPLVAMFAGRVAQLSKQKFSSNVIEKCLRCAQEPSKDMLIEEMLQPNQLDSLLRDSFANYVIQTALDYANPNMKTRLIEAIRPHLPAIRTTPYGRRIQAKIQGNENRGNTSTGPTTPNDNETGQLATRHQRGMSIASVGAFVSSPGGFPNGIGPAPLTNGLPLPAIRSPPHQGAGFPPNDRLTSPAAAHPYTYGRAGPQPGAGGNWL
ncbi:hypothetical protein SBOR_4567 [Sclerotinia borealis F-4128]|uniref:PUM-HD domain-containing protein n=1 Tax=Sclerotinia borealis (strain F-4128) TaxID=1432307 RepID=W9CK35_SCLBF|nr:hypothetical protein SBOR_4567 [Sclerotinia borealis F-4128]